MLKWGQKREDGQKTEKKKKIYSILQTPEDFLEFSGFFNDPADVGNLISGSSAFSKTRTSLVSQMVEVSAYNAGNLG